MCGIVGAWAKEDHIPFSVVDTLFKFNEKRGRDGFGYSKINLNTNDIKTRKSAFAYSNSIFAQIELDSLPKNHLLLGICRAKPETEVETREEDLERTMQPIVRDNCIVVHNGSINTYYDDCESWKQTDIDSECIIYQYIKRGFPKFVEHIPGGFSFLLYDKHKKSLIVGTNHMPLYHMYIKGVGYFVSSVKEALDEILNYYFSLKHDSMNVWEAWYHTEVEAFSVREIDLDSGMIKKFDFKPLYLLPNMSKST